MSDQQQPIKSADPFSFLDSADLRQIIHLKGIYVRGFVEAYEVVDKETKEKKRGTYGNIQVLCKVRDDSDRLELKSIKVQEDAFGLVDILNKGHMFKPVVLDCQIVEGFQGKLSTYLLPEQRMLNGK